MLRHLLLPEFDPHPIELPPPLTTREKIHAAAKTVLALQELGRKMESDDDAGDEAQARQIFTDARLPSPAELSKPALALKLEALLSEYDYQVVQDATQIRNYVTNRLIDESNHPDVKIRLRSLEMLGKISDVGLFTEKREIKITHTTDKQLDEMLAANLEKLISASEGSHTFIDVTPEYVTQPTISADDMMQEMGLV